MNDDVPANSWRHERPVLAVVAVVAVVVRLAVFIQLSGTSAFELHRWAQSDMNFFDVWGEAVAEGDVWSRDVGHPLHEWHEAIAMETAIQRGDAPVDQEAYARDLWDQWYGGPRWHQEPLYAYLLATVFAVGGDVGLVFALQALIGLLTVAATWGVTRRAFGPSAAIVAAVAAAVAAPLVFFETVLLRAALVTALGMTLVLVTSLALERGRRWWWATGALLGLTLLARSVFALFGAALVVQLLVQRRAAGGRPAGIVVLGALIVVLPALGRNVIVGAPVLSLSSVNAVTFMTSNTYGYDPADAFDVNVPEASRILDETGGAGWATTVATLQTHPGVGSIVALVAGKAFSAMHAWEKPNNVSLDFHRRLSPVLAGLPVSFGVVLPLATVGVVLGRRRPGAGMTLAPLAYLAGLTVATMLVAYVLARFRLPLLAALLPWAGAGAVALVRFVRAGAWSRVVVGAIVLIAVAAASNRAHPRVRLADYAAAFEVHFAPQAQAAAERGDAAAERAALDAYLRLEPDEFPDGPEGERLRQSFDVVRALRDRAH